MISAVFIIGLISSLIILSALYVTSKEQKIPYKRFTVEELLWVSEQRASLHYFWHKDLFFFFGQNESWGKLDVNDGSVLTVADALDATVPVDLRVEDLQPISGLWPNADRSAWLIQFGGKRVAIQDSMFSYAVVLSDGKTRIPVRIGDGDLDGSLHSAVWGPEEFALFVQKGSDVFYSANILPGSTYQDFYCLTCTLSSRWIYGYPGWIYREYFHYHHTKGFWWQKRSGGFYLLVLATDESHLRKFPISVHQNDEDQFTSTSESAVYLPYGAQVNTSRAPVVSVLLMKDNGELLFNLSYDALTDMAEQSIRDRKASVLSKNIYLTHVQWFNQTGFLVFGVQENQRCGFITFCAISHGGLDVRCEIIWHQCVEKGWLDMVYHPHTFLFCIEAGHMGNLDCAKDGDASFLIPLPFGKRYQVAAVHIVPGQKNRITWLTESPFNVLKIVHANKNFILFLAATKPTESHLYRLDSDRRTIYCLTCKIVVEPLVEDKTHHHHRQRIYRTPALRVRGEAVESTESAVNDTYLKISKIKVSDNGLYFTTEFYSGYEPLGGSAMKEAPTRLLINQLTGQVTEASEQDTSEFVPSIRIDQDVGIGLWHIAEGAGPGSLEVHLVWHSHLLIVNENEVNDSIDHQNMTNDPNGDGLTRAARSPLAQLPNKMAKQHHILESTYKMKVKPKFLNAVQSPLHLLHPPAPFGSRPVSNLAIRTVNFSPSKAPETTKGKIDLSASFSNQEVVKNGALLRIWFPPYLNERHLRLYPLLLNIRSKYGQQTSGINHLMDELIILISGSLDVIVMEVQCWLGTAASLVDRDGMNGEVQNYHTLLKLLSENYHYIERNRSAIIGFQGANAHVAGMLVGSEKAALNPKCGALISPVVSWRLHEYTEAIRIFGAVPGIKHLEYDLTRQVKRYRNSEILIVHGTADTRVPFSQTMKLVDAMAQENIDFSLLPLFDEDHTYRDVRTREAVLRRIATFLFDCLHHSPNDENRFHAVWTSNLEKASSSTEF